jgi:hypothetical protein
MEQNRNWIPIEFNLLYRWHSNTVVFRYNGAESAWRTDSFRQLAADPVCLGTTM